MKEYFFLMDVGGTDIKVNCLSKDRQVLFNENKIFPSQSTEKKTIILENFKNIIIHINKEMIASGYILSGVGIAIPGPFNYQEGISLMKEIRKYDAIFEVNVKQLVLKWLKEELDVSVPIVFQNDATSFGLGEYFSRLRGHSTKGMYITLGTGCGSAFIHEGKLVKKQYGLNSMGMIYDIPFIDSTIDRYLSIAGLKYLADMEGYQFHNGFQLYRQAEAGDRKAQAIFIRFGEMLAQGLMPFIKNFHPDEVVFGGQVSNSFHYFHDSFKHTLEKSVVTCPIIRKSQDTSLATMIGLIEILAKELRTSM